MIVITKVNKPSNLSTRFGNCKFLFITNHPAGKEEHDETMTTVAKHHSKQKWEGYDRKQS